MAVIQHRRWNLRLPLPERLERHVPLPLPPLSPSASSITFSDLEKLGVLGHGNSGTVYKVLHKPTSSFHALKHIPAGVDPVSRRQVRREIDILRRTDSPFVVKCHGVSEHPSGEISIVMEYMDAGTLANLPALPERSLALVARQVLAGLHYLHSRKIIHRDIKPANLLVNRNMEVKIADFGVGRIMCRSLDTCDSFVGTCAYMSPERFDPDSHGPNYNGYAGDIWSLGLTLLELYMGRLPFLDPGQRPDWATLMCAICLGDPPVSPEGASEEFSSFMDCCLQRDSNNRWTAAQLLLHPFLNPDPDFCN